MVERRCDWTIYSLPVAVPPFVPVAPAAVFWSSWWQAFRAAVFTVIRLSPLVDLLSDHFRRQARDDEHAIPAKCDHQIDGELLHRHGNDPAVFSARANGNGSWNLRLHKPQQFPFSNAANRAQSLGNPCLSMS